MENGKVTEEVSPEEGNKKALDELVNRLKEKAPNGHRIEFYDDTGLMEDLRLVNEYYDKNLPGEAKSKRPVFGPFFSLAKRAIRKLTGWYVNPALDSQRLFNTYVTRSINDIKRYLDHLQINEDILSTIMRRDLALFNATVSFLNHHIEGQMRDFESEIVRLGEREGVAVAASINRSIESMEEAENLVESLDVLELEQRIHGTPQMVKERKRIYLEHFRGCRSVLALGCGRGELLQLLTDQGIPARGVDTNPALVGYCRDHDLDVIRADPLEYLEAQKDESLDGIVLSRFAGHQSPAQLIQMLKLCRQKLTDEGLLVIEAPNPFSLYAVASYAIDDGGQFHPLHPETLRQICLSYDFLEPEVIFLNPVPPEEHLEEVDLSARGALLSSQEQELFRQVNQNFYKLNRLLFSHGDYALVTRLGAREAT